MINTDSLKNILIDRAVSGKISSDFSAKDTVDEIVQSLPQISKKRKKLLEQNFEYGERFDIPLNWKWIRLGEISSYGDAPVKVDVSKIDQNTWILDLEDIKSGGKLLVKNRAQKKFFSGEKNAFKAGQILYGKLRPYLKKMLVADEDGASTPELISFDVFGRVVPQYIVYCLLGSFTNRAINMRSYGVKMPRIDMGFMANMPIPIPPISEQKYIVKKLESAFLLIDTIDAFQKKYASNEKALKSKLINAGIQGWLTEQLSKDGDAEKTIANILKNKKEMQKKGVIKKSKPLPAITDKDIPFKIPANWKWVRLDDITTKITSGNTPVGGRKSNVYVEKGNCFFREQNIYNDGIHQEGMVYITDELLNTRKNSTVIAKDILLNITGGSIGRCALIPDDFSRGSINQHILIIRMVDERMRFYVHMFLCSAYAQKFIKYKAVGDKDGFSAGKCKQMLIPLPPIPEQQRIVKKINDYLSIMSLVSKQF